MGFFENLLSSIFGTKKDDSKSTNQPAGAYTVSRLMSDLEVDRPTINGYMRENNIVPVNDTLTQEQINKIYDSHLRHKAGGTIAQPPIVRKTVKTSQPPQTPPGAGISPAKKEHNPPAVSQNKKAHKVTVQAMTNIPNTPIERSKIPGENDKVFTPEGREYTLTRFIASGGEGSIYAVDTPGKIAKIYNAAHCTMRVRDKIKLMAGSKLKHKGICFPAEVLNNSEGEFCGFIMPEAKGKNLSSLFIPQRDFETEFPGWKKIDLVNLSISILRKIKYLHDHDVLMGDISPFNIMFVSPDEVYFIDTDSYQFGPFPCTVGTNNFVAPELLGKSLGNIMRTQGNENFAVATLLFMLMMQGKQPYSHQGGSQSAEDVKAGIFPYGAGKRPVPGNVWELQPVGLWRYLWSHLKLTLKDAFIDTFRQDGNNNTESTRLNVGDWLTLMFAYKTAYPGMIDNEHDPMSAEIFPTREKINPNLTYYTCATCVEKKPSDMFHDPSTCWECYNEKRRKEDERRKQIYTTIHCSDCGQTFTITVGEYEYLSSKGYSLPKRCESCRKKTRVCSRCGKEKPERMFYDYTTCKECHNKYRNSSYGTYRCSNCGRYFTITNGEYEFYTSRGYDLPKRCPSCRGAKKGY